MDYYRDDFSASTKELLANRVGRRCSNPSCRKLTCCANERPDKIVNIGVAAHICAAAEGGPRYVPFMSKESRRSAHNGIWLCQNCAKLIDSDIEYYTVRLLHEWRDQAEKLAIEEVTSTSQMIKNQDIDLIKFYVQCFERPAFQGNTNAPGQIQDFYQAVEDTILALNTGVLRTRDGTIIKQAEGKSAITNPTWRIRLDYIVDNLILIKRKVYDVALMGPEVYYRPWTSIEHSNGLGERELGEWIDDMINEILKTISSICVEAKIGMPYSKLYK